jgi:hypothetical protein
VWETQRPEKIKDVELGEVKGRCMLEGQKLSNFGKGEAGWLRPEFVPDAHVQEEAGFFGGFGCDESGGSRLHLHGEQESRAGQSVEHHIGVRGDARRCRRVQRESERKAEASP